MHSNGESGESRREFLRKGAYVVPAVLTLSVTLVEARAGSMDIGPNQGRGEDPSQELRETRETRDTRDLSR
jgi:hypothetical protein